MTGFYKSDLREANTLAHKATAAATGKDDVPIIAGCKIKTSKIWVKDVKQL